MKLAMILGIMVLWVSIVIFLGKLHQKCILLKILKWFFNFWSCFHVILIDTIKDGSSSSAKKENKPEVETNLKHNVKGEVKKEKKPLLPLTSNDINIRNNLKREADGKKFSTGFIDLTDDLCGNHGLSSPVSSSSSSSSSSSKEHSSSSSSSKVNSLSSSIDSKLLGSQIKSCMSIKKKWTIEEILLDLSKED